MSHQKLREIAKFASGLVVGDIISLLWFWSYGQFPVHVWGMRITNDILFPSVVFDIAILIILIHYGWHLGRIPRVKERSYMLVAGCIFSVVAAAHLLRLFTGGDIILFGWAVPLWLSWIPTVVATYLAYSSFHFATRSK